MNDIRQYNQAARYLHWLIAGLVICQYVLANLAEAAEQEASALQVLANHRSVGITILLLALVRLGWRLMRPPPPLQDGVWLVRLAHAAHWLLYLLLIAVPISGWLMSSAGAHSVVWFNLVPLPDLLAADEGLEELLEETHETLAGLLFLVSVGHLGAALWHRFVRRDDVLQSMWSAPAFALAAAVLVAAVILLG